MNKVQIFTIIVAVTVAFSFAIAWYVREGKLPKTADTETKKVSDFVMDEKVTQYFEEARYITIEKVERTCIDYEDGSFDASYDTYLVSDIDLEKEKENTQDYAASLEGEGMEDEKIETLAFKDALGFSFNDKNAWEIFSNLAKENDIDKDLSDVDFEKDTYAVTKQKLYVLRGNCSILDKMLEGINDEDVVEKKVYYQTVEAEEGIEVPEGITAYVQYKKGTSYVTKTMYLELIVNHWTNEEV